MPKGTKQKAKILYILNLLLEQSDEAHILSMSKILSSLEKAGISAERKSVYSDIEQLRTMGYDVICKRGRDSGYYIGQREFELPELKLLVDSVQSSKFITKKKSDALIGKLERLTSRHLAKDLQRQVYTIGRVKAANERIYYHVDKLHTAIATGRKVKFQYAEYSADKTRRLRNGGADYLISPYGLTFSDDNYYVIAHYPKYEGLTNFRVDRMENVRVTRIPSVDIQQAAGKDFQLTDYIRKTFDMFSGSTETVQVECDNSLINAVVDKFGEDVQIRKKDGGHFYANLKVNISPTFFGWVFLFGDKMRILSPEPVVAAYKAMLEKVLKQLNSH